MGRARFRVSTYRLEQLLQLPYIARIIKIEGADNPYIQEYWITVEHPDLPDGVEIHPYWNEKTVKEFIGWEIEEDK
jgi:hypothetical protein